MIQEISSNLTQSFSAQKKGLVSHHKNSFQSTLTKSMLQRDIPDHDIQKHIYQKENIESLSQNLKNLKDKVNNVNGSDSQQNILETLISFLDNMSDEIENKESKFSLTDEDHEELFALIILLQQLSENSYQDSTINHDLLAVLISASDQLNIELEVIKESTGNLELQPMKIQNFKNSLQHILAETQTLLSQDHIPFLEKKEMLNMMGSNKLEDDHFIDHLSLHEKQSQIFIQDTRLLPKPQVEVQVEVIESLLDYPDLEFIDSSQRLEISEDIGMIQGMEPCLMKGNTSMEVSLSAQKMYTALSSSVTRVEVEALMQNISGKVSILLQDHGNELRMKLTPPELGNMKLSFITEDSIMRGKIVVETQEAKSFFEQNIHNLRETLANAGVSLGQIDVELGGHHQFREDIDNDAFQAVRMTTNSAHMAERTERKEMVRDSLVDFTA